MVRHFRLYLTAILILFTLIISAAIGLYDYFNGQKQIRLNHEKEINMIEDSVVQSLHIIDQMYNLTNDTLGNKMKENMDILIEKYKENPNFERWDFEQLNGQFNMDVYVIDDTNTVIYTSLTQDIGLNFNECCGSFGDVIKNRRLGNEFKHDGMDIQQSTGEIKKFAYMPTPDNQYLLELSMSLEDGEVFKSFNILNKMKELEEQYKPIHSIRLYNITGLSFGSDNVDDGPSEVSAEMRPYFDKAKKTNERQEKTIKIDGINVTYRYIPYVAASKDDFIMRRVVEIIYSEVELASLLKFYRDGFLYQQLIILLTVILLAIVIGKIISQPVHLAFHDSLTGLKNRAAFEIEGNSMLRKRKNQLSLMMIDVDNFKNVNDRLGHLAGDRLLEDIANLFVKLLSNEHFIARLGGDEFVILSENKSEEEIQSLSKNLLQQLNLLYNDLNKQYSLELSISIGIAYAYPGDELETLYKKADFALYEAKGNGKNQYEFYKNVKKNNDMAIRDPVEID